MEDCLWEIVVLGLPESEPAGRQRYSDREILLVLLWVVLHDRPVAWACDAGCWPTRRRLRRLPHASTVSRRARGMPTSSRPTDDYERSWSTRRERRSSTAIRCP